MPSFLDLLPERLTVPTAYDPGSSGSGRRSGREQSNGPILSARVPYCGRRTRRQRGGFAVTDKLLNTEALPISVTSAFLCRNTIRKSQMPEPDPEEKIDATFRNGSLTAAGIILGFSLSFIGRWVSNPNDWSTIDIVPMVLLTIGIALQVKVFADLLARDSLIRRKIRPLAATVSDWPRHRGGRNGDCVAERYSGARVDADAGVRCQRPQFLNAEC